MPDESEEIAKLRAELEVYKRALENASAAVPIAVQGVIEHVPGVTRCAHVEDESDSLSAWALVRVQTLPECEYRGSPLSLAVIACPLCAGRVFGSMLKSDAEHGMTRDEIDAAVADASAVVFASAVPARCRVDGTRRQHGARVHAMSTRA